MGSGGPPWSAAAIDVYSHGCLIEAGRGAVVCWGEDNYGQETPPPSVDGTTGTASAIALGSAYSCAIQAGTDAVVCWGLDDYGQATPPPSVNGTAGTASAIAAGDSHTLAILTATECYDGIDNDSDGATEYPADPACWSTAAPVESAECDDGIAYRSERGRSVRSTHSLSVSVAVVAFTILTGLTGPLRPARAAPTVEVVKQSEFPITLTVGSDGRVYGTTSLGGEVFRVEPSGTATTLHTFVNEEPHVLVVGTDGALYSAAERKFFRISNDGVYSLIYTLPDSTTSKFVLGSDGFFYSTLRIDSCATGNCTGGNIFKVDNLGNFALVTGMHPDNPPIPSVVGSDGAIYGSRFLNAFPIIGLVFRLATAGNYTVLHNMDYTVDGLAGQLALGGDGLIYGTSSSGGTGNVGTVFRFDSAGNFTVLHSFDYSPGSGFYPVSPLTRGSDGAMYGITTDGGIGFGLVYRVDAAGAYSTLHSFDATEGSPGQSLLLAQDGALYGITYNNYLFRVNSPGTYSSQPFNVADPFIMSTPLLQGGDCAFYGAAHEGSGVDWIAYRIFTPGQLCQQLPASVPSMSPAGLATVGLLMLFAGGYALRRRRG